MEGRTRICMVGSSNTDLVARVPRLPRRGECLTGTDFSIGFGGKGANQAVMAARLGADVSVVSRLGRDVFGESYLRHYASEGVDTRFVTMDDDQASGAALIFVEETAGLNTMAYIPGANARLSPADLRACASVIGSADILICQLETPVSSTLEAFRIARASGPRRPRTLLNAAPVPVPPDPLPAELLELTDILVANEEEAAWLAGMAVATPDQAVTAAHLLATRWDATSILTLGDRGVVLAEHGLPATWIEVPKVDAVDTTGAGDSFVGSLAWLLGTGLPMRDAVERASAVATLSVLRAGAQPSFPTREEVRARLGW